MLKSIIAFFVFLLMTGVAHAESAFPQRGTSAVVDASNVLTTAQTTALNKKLVEWQRRTKHQLVVVTVPDLKGQSLQGYSYQLGRLWRLGQTGVNDGAILILATGEKTARLEVGVGLEGVLTDAESLRILRSVVYPALATGGIYKGLDTGVDAITSYIDAHEDDVKRNTATHENVVPWLMLLLSMIIFGLVVVAWYRSRKGKKNESSYKHYYSDYSPPAKPVKPGTPAPNPTFGGISSPGLARPKQTPVAPIQPRSTLLTPTTYQDNPYLRRDAPETPPTSDIDYSDLIAAAAIGSILTDAAENDDKRRESPKTEEPLGFVSNNEDDRSFGGGGAEISYDTPDEPDQSSDTSESSDNSCDSSDD